MDEDKESLDPTHFKFLFNSSSCGQNIISIEVQEAISKEENTSLTIYSIIISLLSLLTTAVTILITYKISKNESKVNALSIITISQSIIWDSYCCISYLSFALHHHSVIYHFIIPSILHMLNFAIVDVRLIYKYWQIKQLSLSSESFQKQKIRFYLGFYLFFFLSFLSINKFFYQKTYIFLLALFIWLPQIIYNVFSNNNISLPIVYVLIVTIDRLFASFYFKGYSGNCFSTSADIIFISMIALMTFVIIILMLSQMIFGPRWFFPYKLRNNQYDYYKTKEEILQTKSDIKEVECVICLFPLFKTERRNVKIVQDDKFLLSMPTEDVIIEVLEQEGTFINKPKKSCCSKISGILFDFESKSLNKYNKEYMITPCNHLFHSPCLELWFERKKECPNCRKQLTDE